MPDRRDRLFLDVTDGRAVESFFAGVGERDHLVYADGEALVVSPLADLGVDQVGESTDSRIEEARWHG